MKNIRFTKRLFLVVVGSLLSFYGKAQKEKDYTKFVDPYIGTEGHGHVFLGASTPSGAVQLGPSNIIQGWDKFGGWDWCSGYNYISKEILGFTHTHLSGTGIGDLNDLLILPANGKPQLKRAAFGDMNSGYGSEFSHKKETVRPGYYKVFLDKYQVTAELTASDRVGFHQYAFPKKADAHILIDLAFGMGWDNPTKTYIKKLNDTTFTGYRFSSGWANDQRLYFCIRTSRPIERAVIYDSTTSVSNVEGNGKQIKAVLYFDAEKDPLIKLKVGISPVSSENALENINAEIPGWNFNDVVKEATAKWNRTLGKIDISADAATKKIFYTAMYHANIAPTLFNDHNGEYMGADKKNYPPPGFNTYSVLSLWDTYRGLHPLRTITDPEMVNEYVRTMLALYQQQGKLPVWHLQGNETNTMIGYPAVPVIVDAYMKGFRNYDVHLAYEAVKQSALQQTNGLSPVNKPQFIPADSVAESVAKAQEYAISDWCIAQMAKDLKKMDDHKFFSQRAKLYSLYFDSSIQFMRGRMADGGWRTPFNPYSAEHRANDYCEGNSWQYTWLVPQDVEGLIKLFGGDAPFTKKLDSLFTVSSVLPGNTSPDISGMIGQYAHGNEPDHHIAYLYNFAGQPWKTATLIRKITDTFYTAKPDGLTGNDDAGEMSVWYIFSAMGFYPVNPANGVYVFGSPLVSSASIELRAGKKFNIQVKNQSKKNKYIQSILLNGKAYTKSYLLHATIMAGGEMEIALGDKPSKTWGVSMTDRPYSEK